jgi:hypothetical protein
LLGNHGFLIVVGRAFVVVEPLLLVDELIALNRIVVLQFQPESISAYAQAHSPLSNGPEGEDSAKDNLSYEDIRLAVAACLDTRTEGLFGG